MGETGQSSLSILSAEVSGGMEKQMEDMKNGLLVEVDTTTTSETPNNEKVTLEPFSEGENPNNLMGVGPPSPLTGCYLLIVIGEPHSQDHKDVILKKLKEGKVKPKNPNWFNWTASING